MHSSCNETQNLKAPRFHALEHEATSLGAGRAIAIDAQGAPVVVVVSQAHAAREIGRELRV